MELVKIEKNEPVTTSVIIANGVNVEHASVIFLIRKHQKHIEEFGTCRFEIEKTKGRPLEFCYLNEAQTTFLITCMRNTETVIKFKKNLVKEFYNMKKVLSSIASRQSNEEWEKTRENAKITRKNETDVIKKFVEYAKSQGSENAEKYYANITNMENKSLFFIQEKFPNLREVLTGHQIGIMIAADFAIETAIKEGMEKEMHYKDIYKLAKQRIEDFGKIIPKTIVPMVEIENKHGA